MLVIFFYVPELVHFIEEMLHCHRWTTATTTAAVVIVSALYPPHCHRHVEAPPTLTPNTTINRHILGGTLHLPQLILMMKIINCSTSHRGMQGVVNVVYIARVSNNIIIILLL